jgi:hypothetical protein
VRVALGKSESASGYVMTYVVVVFVLIQTGLILYRWIKSYYEKEKPVRFMMHKTYPKTQSGGDPNKDLQVFAFLLFLPKSLTFAEHLPMPAEMRRIPAPSPDVSSKLTKTQNCHNFRH